MTIATARATLASHRMSPQTERCAVCRRACPCRDANDAANTLAEHGLSVLEVGTARQTARSGWSAWLARIRGWIIPLHDNAVR